MANSPDDRSVTTEREEIRYISGLIAREASRVAALPEGWARRTMLRIFEVFIQTYDLPPLDAPPVATLTDAKAEFDARISELRIARFDVLSDQQFVRLSDGTSIEIDELSKLSRRVGAEHVNSGRHVDGAVRVGGMWACGVLTGALAERMRR